MSIIHIMPIKKHLNDAFINLIDMSGVDENQYESKFLTRALACHAIEILTNNTDFESISKFITDDYNDNGIDLIYYDDTDKKLYIVQSKWSHNGSGSPSLGDVLKFLKGIKDLFHFRFESFNQKFQKHQKLLENIIESTQTRYEIVLIYSGQENLASQQDNAINDFLEEINDPIEIVSKKIISQAYIHKFLSKNREPKVNLDLELMSWGKIEKPHSAFYGSVSAKNILNWWQEYRHDLFHKNIRNMLGDTGVNRGIKDSLQLEGENFWYYNNGITLIAEEIKKSAAYASTTEIGVFKCIGCSIVNGAQTVASIGEFAEQSLQNLINLENIYVSCKVISLENSDEIFGRKITINNNKQNKIENRDFVSLDINQIRIRNELLLEDIKYHITRSTTASGKNSLIEFDLQDATIACACACGDIDICTQARREISKIWEDINSSIYTTLFNDKTCGKYVWFCINVIRYIDKALEEARNSSEKLTGITIYGNRLIAYKTFEELKRKGGFDWKNIDVSNIDAELIQNIVNQEILNVNDYIETHYKLRMLPSIFKNISICNEIVNVGKKNFKQMSLFDLLDETDITTNNFKH